MNVGLKIKQLRLKNNWNQKVLADKLNVSINAISQYETNKRIPDLETIKNLSSIFHVSVSYFLTDTPEDAAILENSIIDLQEESHKMKNRIDESDKLITEVKTKHSYTITLLKTLIENGALEKPEDITEKHLDLLVDMLKLDAEELMKK